MMMPVYRCVCLATNVCHVLNQNIQMSKWVIFASGSAALVSAVSFGLYCVNSGKNKIKTEIENENKINMWSFFNILNGKIRLILPIVIHENTRDKPLHEQYEIHMQLINKLKKYCKDHECSVKFILTSSEYIESEEKYLFQFDLLNGPFELENMVFSFESMSKTDAPPGTVFSSFTLTSVINDESELTTRFYYK